MEYFASALWSLLELIAFHFFWRAFLSVRTTKKAYLLSFASAWLLPTIYTLVGLEPIYGQIISIGILAFICIWNYMGSFLQKMLFLVLAYTFVSLADAVFAYGASAVLGVPLTVLVWKKLMYTLVMTISKMLSILFAWTVFRIREKQKSEDLQYKWLLLTLLFPLVSLVMITTIFRGYRDQEDLSLGAVVFSAFLALANVAIIYLVQIMEKSTAESKKLALLNQQMEIQTGSILALERNYRAQRKATHEFQNQLQTIHSLIATGEHERAQEYIQQLQGAHPARVFTVNSQHPIIDAVLNQKYQLANESSIDVRIQVNDLSGVSLGTDQLVVLLSNLLDNAIEACQRHDGERIIQCSILASDSLYISIRNTSLPVKIEDKHIPTSKEPKEDHGYGLAHVDLILTQLQAEYILSYKDGWFEFATEIPLAAKV